MSTSSGTSPHPEEADLLEFSVYGQTFRLRATESDARRIRKVAAEIESRVRDRRRQGASSDLRAALMVAYELGFELDRAAEENRLFKQENDKALAPAVELADRIIDRLDAELNREKLEKKARAKGERDSRE